MKIGDLLVNAAYLGGRVLTAIAVGATKVWEGVSKYIKFADPVVEQLCMKWSSDGVGLTPEDAAKVEVSQTFRSNTEIVEFDEFRYFTASKNLYFAFANCTRLKRITLPDISFSSLVYAFNGCTELESITIPESVTSIGSNAFYKCSSLTFVTIPESVTSIGERAFADCTSLANIAINKESKIISIGERAFGGCAFFSIILPKTTENIGAHAFYFARNLNDFVCYADVPPIIESMTFYGNSVTLSIYVPDDSVDAYKAATNWSAHADRIKPLSEYQPTNE